MHQDLPTPEADCEHKLREALESSGWRYTRQREAVYRFLQKVRSHPTAEEVYSGVKRQLPHISLATVYKSLEALVACKLAAKLTYGDGSARYDCRCDDHYHVRCVKSGKVEDLPTPYDSGLLNKLDPSLASRLADQGFHVTGYRLEVLGYYGQPASDDDARMSGPESPRTTH